MIHDHMFFNSLWLGETIVQVLGLLVHFFNKTTTAHMMKLSLAEANLGTNFVLVLNIKPLFFPRLVYLFFSLKNFSLHVVL